MAPSKKNNLQPGDTIAILGGGQLGRMLAGSAAKFGLKTIIVDPDKNCPAAQMANHHLVLDYSDLDALAQLVKRVDAITYEFENIPLETVNFLEENKIVFPDSFALEKSQDRVLEKRFINAQKIATAPWYPIDKLEDISKSLNELGTGAILKTRRFGYDGKGQARLEAGASPETISSAFASIGKSPAILEGYINFTREISVIIARGQSGEIQCFDPAENVHKNGILHTSTVPAATSIEILNDAKEIAAKLANALDYVGVMGVEFFVQPDGSLIVNEFAPRVHNSGHWTEAACVTSQFDQHIRAIAGWPLGSAMRHSNCIMENLIGNEVSRIPQLLKMPSTSIQLYGKSEIREGRKMGHYTTLTEM